MTTFEIGKWKVQCDRCGFWMKSPDLRLEWTGLRVCEKCWEPRHPQDMLRGKYDVQAPPWARPQSDGEDITIETGIPVRPEDL